MYNVLDIARYVINRSSDKGSPVSNLKLQKMLYYIQAAFLIETKDRCFNDPILCWRHGPVVKRAYDEFSRYASNEIPAQKTYQKIAIENGKLSFGTFTFSDSFLSSDDHKQLLDNVIDGLLPYNPWYLVDRTHEESSWKSLTVYNVEITPESIADYFKNHPRRVYGEFN